MDQSATTSDEAALAAVEKPAAAADRHPERSAYAHALISELRLLVRAIANDPNKRLNTLRLSYQLPEMTKAEDLTFDKILNKLASIESDPKQQAALEYIAFLQAVRDALVAITTPATGLTIAYTALVTGGQRSDRAESSYDLAAQAYGRLRHRAAWHSRFAWCLMAIAVVCMTIATWEATAAALGKSLLQNMDLLRSQQVVLMEEKLKLETSLDKPLDEADLSSGGDRNAVLSSAWLPLCDRFRNRLMIAQAAFNGRLPTDGDGKPLGLAASPAERDLCGRETVLTSNIATVHREMQVYLASWPQMAGGVVAFLSHLFSSPGEHRDPCPSAAAASTRAGTGSLESTCDVEFLLAPRLQVITNYNMPLVFGILGSLLYVLLDHFTKLRSNTLNPKDLSLMPLRLILGLVIASCVSLLVTSYASPSQAAASATAAGGPPPVSSLIASLTLSASGLAFLAGFGAEAVFTLLQNLIERVFAAQK